MILCPKINRSLLFLFLFSLIVILPTGSFTTHASQRPTTQDPPQFKVYNITVGNTPCYAVYDSSNGYVYVLTLYCVYVISGTSIIANISIGGGTGPNTISYDPLNGYIYVAHESLIVISGTSIIANMLLPTGVPLGAVYDPSNGFMYVISSFGITILSGTLIVTTIPLSIGNTYFAVYDPSNEYIYVGGLSISSIFAISGTSIVANITVGFGYFKAVYDPSDKYIYVLNPYSRLITVISGTSVITTIQLTNSPWDAVYDPSNGYVYVTNTLSNSVSVIMEENSYYTVTFIESGLPLGTTWSVTLNGTTKSSNTSTIVFQVPNGIYSYIVSPVQGYYSSPSSGNVTVNNSNVTVYITFNKILYTVTFIETGLPPGTTWSVMIDNITKNSTSNEISFQLPLGKYRFTILPVNGYNASPMSGYITVFNSTVVYIAFKKILYTVTFVESGLPLGTTWSVTLNGTISNSTTNNRMVFRVHSGVYYFTITPINGYNASPSNGYVNITDSDITIYITFTKIITQNYSIIFIETGLPPGTTWSITLNGTTKSTTSNEIIFTLPKGIYSYSLIPPKGYSVSNSSGTIILNSDKIIMLNYIPIGQTLNNNNQTIALKTISNNKPTKLPYLIVITLLIPEIILLIYRYKM